MERCDCDLDEGWIVDWCVGHIDYSCLNLELYNGNAVNFTFSKDYNICYQLNYFKYRYHYFSRQMSLTNSPTWKFIWNDIIWMSNVRHIVMTEIKPPLEICLVSPMFSPKIFWLNIGGTPPPFTNYISAQLRMIVFCLSWVPLCFD